jgi:hypothetical protein
VDTYFLYVDTYLWPCDSFVPPLREAKCFGVPSCVFDKLGRAAGEKRVWNTALQQPNAES